MRIWRIGDCTKLKGEHSEQNYKNMLSALQNLGNPKILGGSNLTSSCLVKRYVRGNPQISSAEALRAVLTELLTLMEVGSKAHLELIYSRFWEGKTLREIRESKVINPLDLSMRTIQDNQKTGIETLTEWFQEREKACKDAKFEEAGVVSSSTESQDARILSMEILESCISAFETSKAKYFVEDFSSYQIGQSPGGWREYGKSAGTKPGVKIVEDLLENQQVLEFPSLSMEATNKDMVRNNPVFKPPFQITLKLKFLNEPSDRAGLLIAWKNRSTLIRVQANLYWNHLFFQENVSGEQHNPIKVPIEDVIEVGADYWLRVIGISQEPNLGLVSVLWSSDGAAYDPILTTKCMSDLTGKIGVCTTGPNLPHVQFSHIEGAFEDLEKS